MFEDFGETGRAEVHAVLGRFTFGRLGPDRAKGRQDLVAVCCPIVCCLGLAKDCQNRDCCVELALCRACRMLHDRRGGGGGGGEGIRDGTHKQAH